MADSACTVQLTNDLSNFNEYRATKGSFQVGNREFLQAERVGTFEGTSVLDENHRCIFERVSY